MVEETKSRDVVMLVPEFLDMNTSFKRGTKLGFTSVNKVGYTPHEGSGIYAVGSHLSWDVNVASPCMGSEPELTMTYKITYVDTEYKTDDATCQTNAKIKAGINSIAGNRLFTNASFNINGQVNLSSNPSQVCDVMLYSNTKDKLHYISTTAVPDNLLAYNSGANTSVIRSAGDSVGWSRGVGSTRLVSWASNTGTTTATIEWQETYKLLMRGSQIFQDKMVVYAGINNIHLDFTIASNADLAIGAGLGSGAITCTEVKDAKLHLHYFTPHPRFSLAPPPYYWNCPKFDLQQSSAITINAGVLTTLDTGSKQYTTRAKRYFLYAEATRPNSKTPQLLFPITNVSVDSGIKENLLKNYSVNQLYNLSVKNGYNGTIHQFCGTDHLEDSTAPVWTEKGNGCMIIFTPQDLDADEFSQSNMLESHNLRVQASVKNHSGTNYAITLKLVCETDAYLEFNGTEFKESYAYIMPHELTTAENMFIDDSVDNHILGGGSSGGSIFDWIKRNVLRPVSRWARTSNVPSQLLGKIDPRLGTAYSAVQSGVNKVAGDYLTKRGWGKGKKKGGSPIVVGGQKMSQQDLIRALNS